jgi:hypothetical protein
VLVVTVNPAEAGATAGPEAETLSRMPIPVPVVPS